MDILTIVLTLCVAVLGMLVIGLLRSHAEILRLLHEQGTVLEQASSSDLPHRRHEHGSEPMVRTAVGVPSPRPSSVDGETAHDLTGRTPQGAAVAVRTRHVEHSTLLAFLTTGCSTCAGFWKEFRTGAPLDLPGHDTRLVIVTKGYEQESASAIARLAPDAVKTVVSSSAWADYSIPVAPYFVLVDGPSGRIAGEGAAASWAQVASLLTQAVEDASASRTHRHDDGWRNGRSRNGSERHADTDAALLAAGITPGHPSLYPERPVDEPAS